MPGGSPAAASSFQMKGRLQKELILTTKLCEHILEYTHVQSNGNFGWNMLKQTSGYLTFKFHSMNVASSWVGFTLVKGPTFSGKVSTLVMEKSSWKSGHNIANPKVILCKNHSLISHLYVILNVSILWSFLEKHIYIYIYLYVYNIFMYYIISKYSALYIYIQYYFITLPTN